MEYEIVIGLEVHVQLGTKTKAFCACPTEFGAPPNSQVCPVCLGFPGAMPVLNKTALEYAIKVGLALDCQVQEYTKFDRKHYYYPDLPKNFQISQYDLPVAKAGHLALEVDGVPRRIGITRAHLEEDAGKLIHKEHVSLVDLNRTGIPLLEIVSEPDMRTPLEAYEYLTRLKSILKYLDVSDCDMEKGSLRCDANISLRVKGETALGTKAELKNLNSFRAVRDALAYEADRQKEVLTAGDKVKQETRLWDSKELKTVSMRSKEEAKDYRYFPEPDLPPCLITREQIEKVRATIPELPKAKLARFMAEYGLSENDARILVADKNNANYAEEYLKDGTITNKKLVANWLIGPFASLASSNTREISELDISPAHGIELLDLVENKKMVSNLAGKVVLEEMYRSHKQPLVIIQEKNLAQISDSGALEADIDAVVQANPKSVQDFLAGKENAVMFLVGQVMKRTGGKANPKMLQDLLRKKLGGGV